MMKQIPYCPNLYVNESGVIIDENNNKVKTSCDKSGEMFAIINSEKILIKKIVADTFLGYTPENKPYINHINKDILNNHVTNLIFSSEDENLNLDNRDHRKYSSSSFIYQVYNDDESIVIDCIGRGEVADLIQYEEISLKNMVGNNRKIAFGPYKGFMIRNTKIKVG